MLKQSFDVIVLGAGAAGLMCALEAGKLGRRVAVIERNDRIGKKILISGGGRCNFTNLYCEPDNFISANPYFCKSALARYTPQDFIDLVEKHGIAYHEKTLGQLFCDGSARQITDMLEQECHDASVQTFLNTHIQKVANTDGFTVRANDTEFRAPALVVATGGLSIPKMGGTPFGHELAQQFGMKLQKTRPALVPFTLSAADRKRYCSLSGLSAEVIVSAGKQSFREKMLITHRGLSGPAILQISSYWDSSQPISIDLAPGHEVTAPLRIPDPPRDLAAAKRALRTILPQRFTDRWLEHHAPSKWTNQGLDDWERQVHHWELTPTGTEGYEKAEVTAGAVSPDELSSKTMGGLKRSTQHPARRESVKRKPKKAKAKRRGRSALIWSLQYNELRNCD